MNKNIKFEKKSIHLEKVFSIISILLGFIGSIYMAKGILRIIPDLMATMSRTYYWYNPWLLENIIFQKADFICGISFICLALVSQFSAIIFAPKDFALKFSYWKSVIGMVCVTVMFLLVTIFFIKPHLIRSYRNATHESLVRMILQDGFKNSEKFSLQRYEAISQYMNDFFDFTKNINESEEDYLKRCAKYFDIACPDTIVLRGWR